MRSRLSSSDVSALILAGGRATRLGGVAKHELVIGGETIFARQVRVIGPRVAEIIVAGNVAGHRCVRDTIAGAGPLAGIAAGLAAVTTPWLLVIAGDMPWISGDLIDGLFALADGHDAACVRERGLPEPLVSVLHARVRPVVDARLAAGRLKASAMFTEENLSVGWLDDPDPRALKSVNAPEDLRE
jgi:molybdopterin-guanine dinucleotide biosynthesis protein A